MYFFFFNDTATTEIYTLSLHDALPISRQRVQIERAVRLAAMQEHRHADDGDVGRSEEHTSELQSQSNIVCRLLLEKKKESIPTRTRTPSAPANHRPPRHPMSTPSSHPA